MIAKCVCDQCSGHIEFEAENAGQTVACPHCGGETTLFIRRPEPIQSLPDGCFYKNGNVAVTQSVLTVGLSTFPISALSSFSIVAIPPSEKKFNRVIISIIVVGAFGLFFLTVNASADIPSIGAGVLGWILIFVSGLSLATSYLAKSKIIGKPSFGLSVNTSGRDQTIITSPEIETVQAIGNALQKAIAKREVHV